MTSLTNDEDLLRLKKTKWKSNLTRSIEEFRDIISIDDNFEKFFGKEYVEKLTEKSAKLNVLIFKLYISYFVVMLSLYASQSLNGEELRILGYSFKNLGSYKELILFIAVILSPISAVMTAYKNYIDALIKECIVKISPDEKVRSFYRHFWVNEYSDALVKRSIDEKNVYIHGFSVFLSAVVAVVIILITMTIVLATFFIQISVIYDVAINPVSKGYINTFVIGFALLSILLSWLIYIVQCPMPETDYGNLEKLKSLKKENPEKYESMIYEKAEQNSKKEERLTIIISALSYLITFASISFIWQEEAVGHLDIFLPKAITGAFFVMVFSNEFLNIIRKIIHRRFFDKYPEDSNIRTTQFIKLEKKYSTLKVVIPTLLTILYSFYTYY